MLLLKGLVLQAVMSPKDVEARKVARDASKAEFTAKGVQVSTLQVIGTVQLVALLLPHPTWFKSAEVQVSAWQLCRIAVLDAPLLSRPRPFIAASGECLASEQHCRTGCVPLVPCLLPFIAPGVR